jgi:hypothetical protein
VAAAEAYCVKCRAKREIKNPEQVTMKNGRPATKGTCPVCGTAPDTATTMIHQVFAELLRVEHTTLVAVIRGDGYHTLWQAGEKLRCLRQTTDDGR